jgi:para-nitrobenzyl esterase
MRSVVETASGRISGVPEDGIVVFRGIPYARPPVGERRLRPPQPIAPWSGVLEAHGYGPAAPQNAGTIVHLLGVALEAPDEDCLRLNVFAPAGGAGRRPVLVWLHGGGFTTGSTAWPVYDPSPLVRRGDVVVVTVQYRLGALGFLPLEREDGGVGNLGLLDQIAALEWVRENAAAFGGDAERVTVFGNSAGAMSIATLLGAPSARGLFRGAIVQSGSADYVHGREDAARVAEGFCKQLGLAPGDERGLREVPLDAWLAAQARSVAALSRELPRLVFQPVVDAALLPRPPLESIAEGEAASVRLLVGTNLDEWRYYGLADPRSHRLDEAGLLRRLERGLDREGRPLARRVLETYRAARQGRASLAPPDLWFAIQSDRWFRHPAMRMAERHAVHQPATFAYLFDWASPALGGALGSCHSLEVPFVIGSVSHPRLRPLVGEGPEPALLCERMQDAWLGFAREGDPAHPGLGAWPGYDAQRRATLRLGRECRVELAPLERERACWDGIV